MNEADRIARTRFFVLGVIRLGGLALVLFGLAIWFERAAFPQIAAPFFAVMGLIEFFFIPALLKAHWRTRDE